MKYISIDGITPPEESLIDFTQGYESLASATVKRKVSGAALVLNNPLNSKIRTNLQGGGYSTLGWDSIKVGQQYVMRCAEPIAVQTASNVITIPAARRSDTGHLPTGLAIANNQRIHSPATLTGTDEYTVTTVSGATAYQVAYYPEITVIITEFKREGKFGWSLTAEEV